MLDDLWFIIMLEIFEIMNVFLSTKDIPLLQDILSTLTPKEDKLSSALG